MIEAERIFEQGYKLALSVGDKETAFRFLNSVGGTRFAMFQYKAAMQAFLDARKLAEQVGSRELAVISTNLSSLYLEQQDFNASVRAAEQALAALRGAGPNRMSPLLRTQCAILRSREGRFDTALALFRQALIEADAMADTATLSLISDQLGYELMKRGRLEEAEPALLEAFRLRRLNRLEDVRYSYYTLGMLRLAQGYPLAAERLLDETARRLESGAGTLALWRVYFERGRARMRAGKTAAALADFEKALELAGRLRLEVLPAESIWVNTGVDQSRVCSELIRAASSLYLESGDPAYARLGFAVLERNRAAGLRALMNSPEEWRKRLPPEYWEALAQYRKAETARLGAERPSPGSDLSRLQYRLTEMEAEAGLKLGPFTQPDPGTARQFVERLRSSLDEDEAFFSFHLDEPFSLLWVVTRRHFGMFRLPRRGHISALAREFQKAMRLGQPEGTLAGERLYGSLFGDVPAPLLAQRRWVLALDGDLFQLPLSALVAGRVGGRPQYLAEAHTLRTLPSALMFSRQGEPAWEGPFVGLGDPIYNDADPRGDRGKVRGLLTGRRATGPLDLARLPGSGREIAACLRAWQPAGGRTASLTGSRATLKELNEALREGPSILHFATHFLGSSGDTAQAWIALGLTPSGLPDLLGPAEIARKRLHGGLVVLSGCSSASAVTLPAEGLMGMTRAWLAAGADSVLATLWPTPDDQGKLLVSFYSHLAELRRRSGDWAVGEALRAAQLEMLHSGTWLQSPRYWGAYIVAQRE